MTASTSPRPNVVWERLRTIDLVTFLGWLEKLLVVVLLLAFSGAFLSLLRSSGLQPADTVGEPRVRLFFAATLLLVLLLAATRGLDLWRVASGDRLLWLLVALVPLSALWSGHPELTLRRSIALLLTTLFGVYLVSRFEENERLTLLTWALGIAACLSLLVAAAMPELGIEGGKHSGSWRGIYHHKNYFGRLMSLSALVFLLHAWRDRRGVYGWGLAVSLFLVFASSSASAYAGTALVLLALPVFAALRWHRSLLGPSVVLAVLLGGLGSLLVGYWTPTMLEAIGRDETLSGRTRIWQALLEGPLLEHPWLGFGYGSFWLDWQGPSYEVLRWFPGWEPKHAHNGYFDIVVQLGLVGLAAFLLQVGRALYRAVRNAYGDGSAAGYWPLVFLTFVLIYNFPETVILERNNIYWVLYVMVSLTLGERVRRPIRQIGTGR